MIALAPKKSAAHIVEIERMTPASSSTFGGIFWCTTASGATFAAFGDEIVVRP
ncbi:hypothetical protein [Rhodococcus sp. 1168]|uniref:hypothetical protein n=1 Tax=Rhodococcus sp. 1168 TaxID=2018041 RepID=UPI00159317A9|nr:hypothetical protein [Rhodococcus sp. 1168]